MRITLQPAADLNPAPSTSAKASATSALPADFGAALAAASQTNLAQATHTTPDRGSDKKNDRSKSPDADDSAPVTQTPILQLASLVLPVPTPTPALSLDLPAPGQDATQQTFGQGSDSSTTATSVASALPEAATSPASTFVDQTLSTSLAVPGSLATQPQLAFAPPAPIAKQAAINPDATTAPVAEQAATNPAATSAPVAEQAATSTVATPRPTTTSASPAVKSAPVANSVSATIAPVPATITSPALPYNPQDTEAQTAPAPAPIASKPNTIQPAVESLPVAASAPATPTTVAPPQPNANRVDAAPPASAPTQVSLVSASIPSTLSKKTLPADGARIHIDPTNLASVKSVTVETKPAMQVQSDAKPLSPALVSDQTSAPVSLPTPVFASTPAPIPTATPLTTPAPISTASPLSTPAPIPTAGSVSAPGQAQDIPLEQNAAAATPLGTDLPAQPASLPPTVADATQNISPLAFAKTQLPVSIAKDENAKPGAVPSKDRSFGVDAKGRRKFDSDSDFNASEDQLSTTASPDAQSDGKRTDSGLQSQQQGSDQQANQHQAGSDATLQQAVQASVAIASPAAHTAPQTLAASQVSNATPAPPVVPSNVNAAPATAVNSAQLVQSIHQTDMRFGMHSPDFGAISINTSLAHQTLSAQISTDHSELSRALAMHLPSMEEKLGNAYGIHAKVEVRDSSTTSYGDSSQQQAQSQQAKGDRQGQRQGGSFMDQSSPMQATMAAFSSSTASVVSSDARLDIRI